MTDEAREELRDLKLLCRSQEIEIHRLKGEIERLKTVNAYLQERMEEK